jgi:hypothetical protein
MGKLESEIQSAIAELKNNLKCEIRLTEDNFETLILASIIEELQNDSK